MLVDQLIDQLGTVIAFHLMLPAFLQLARAAFRRVFYALLLELVAKRHQALFGSAGKLFNSRKQFF